MAADGRLTPTGETVCKLVRLPNGGVAGASGTWSAAYAALCWFAEGGALDGRGDRAAPDVEDAQVLIIQPDGSKWTLDGRFPAYPILGDSAAIGCGRDGAVALMSAGYSPLEAVAMVARLDPACGEPLQVIRVEKAHEYSGPVPFAKPKPKRRK